MPQGPFGANFGESISGRFWGVIWGRFGTPRAMILRVSGWHVGFLWGAALGPSLDSLAQALKPGSGPRLCIQAQHVGFESKLGIRPLNSGSESWLGMMVMTPGSESRC